MEGHTELNDGCGPAGGAGIGGGCVTNFQHLSVIRGWERGCGISRWIKARLEGIKKGADDLISEFSVGGSLGSNHVAWWSATRWR